MKIAILHVNLDMVRHLSMFQPVVHQPGAYVLAAVVDARDCDDAYAASQNIDDAWCTPPCRSTSVGDILVCEAPDGTQAWLVDNVGFKRLDASEEHMILAHHANLFAVPAPATASADV